MTSEEKRDIILNQLKKELEKNPPSINAGGPRKLKSAKLFVVKSVQNASNGWMNAESSVAPVTSEPSAPSINLSFSGDILSGISAKDLNEEPKDNNEFPDYIEQNASSRDSSVMTPRKEQEEFNSPEEFNKETTEKSHAQQLQENVDPDAEADKYHDDGYFNEDGEFIHINDMTKKEYKHFLKEKKKEAKFYDRVRKDVHKRGYDTTVLEHFEEIEEIYDLSNEEIDQIRAAGFINQDNFYSFMPPDDYGQIKRESIATRNVVIVCTATLLCIVIAIFTIRYYSNIF